MAKYKVEFMDGSFPEFIEADKVFPDKGAFFFQSIYYNGGFVSSQTHRIIPMVQVRDVEFLREES